MRADSIRTNRIGATMRRLASLTLAALLLATPAKAEVEPGSTPVDLVNAQNMFQKICVETLPDFAKAPAILNASGFVASPKTGTLFHPSLNLSFQVKPGKAKGSCSMVFVSRDEPLQLGIAFGTAAQLSGRGDGSIGMDPSSGYTEVDLGKGTIMTFEPSIKNGREQFFRAFISNGN